MKRSIMLSAIIVVVLLGVAVLATPSFANDPFTKLGRGVANTLTGWVELPKNIYDTSVQENAFSGITMGLAKGVGMTVVRTGAGLYEIATFPFPLPEDFRPILEPEYVF